MATPAIPRHPVPRGLEGLCAGCGRLADPGEEQGASCPECGLPARVARWHHGPHVQRSFLVFCLAIAGVSAFFVSQVARASLDRSWSSYVALTLPAGLIGLLAALGEWGPRERFRRLARGGVYTARRRPPRSLPACLPQPSDGETTYPLMVGAQVGPGGHLLEASGVSCWSPRPRGSVDLDTVPPERAEVLRELARLDLETDQLEVLHGPQRRWHRRAVQATGGEPRDYRTGGEESAWECLHLDGAHVHVALPLLAAHPTAALLDDGLGAPIPGVHELARLVRWLSADPARLADFVARVKDPHPGARRPGKERGTPLYLPVAHDDEHWPRASGSMVERRAGELAAMMRSSQR